MRTVLFITVPVVLLIAAGAIGYALGNSNEEPAAGPTGETSPPWTETTPTGESGLTGETSTTGEPSDPGSTTTTDRSEGLNLTVYTPGGYGTMKARKSIQLLKNLGSNSVTIVPSWYMKKPTSNRIEPNRKKSPTDQSLGKIISWAKQAGLSVILKPHVDVNDESFRGDVQPADRNKWFSSYRNFIGHYAGLAANNGAETFVVGTELKSVSGDTEPWKKVIKLVRGKFDGQLTYAANWDEVDQVQFWDALDLIGVDAYYPLASEGQDPTVGDLVNAWQTPISNLKATSERWGKPLMFTEIGYPSQSGAAAHPHEVKQGDPPDQKAQAIAYRAALTALADKSWFRGMNWWSWRADPGKDEQMKIDYTPQGKKAEDVLIEEQSG